MNSGHKGLSDSSGNAGKWIKQLNHRVMKNFAFDNCLVIAGEDNANVQLSARNAVGYKVMPVAGLNVYDILKYSKLMLMQSSLEQLEARLMVWKSSTI